jgi:ABC-type polysaccharide/polyol phosphate transport system ATPase subunit
MESATTLILVSHNNEQIQRLCKKAAWLREGELVMTGDSQSVCDAYTEYYNR